MALENVLAREFIEFAVKGDREADDAIGMKKTLLDRATEAAANLSREAGEAMAAFERRVDAANKQVKLLDLKKAFDSGDLVKWTRAAMQAEAKLTTIQKRAQLIAQHGKFGAMWIEAREKLAPYVSSLDKVFSTMAKIGGVAGGLLLFFARGAAAGTVEGERLAKAWEMFQRVVGDILAPKIRWLTEKIQDLTQWWIQLDDATKTNVANWTIAVAAIGAFVALLPSAISAIQAVIAVLGVLMSPIGLAIGGFVALAIVAGKAFGHIEDEGVGASDSLIMTFHRWFDMFLSGIQVMVVAAAKLFNWLSTQVSKFQDWYAEQLAGLGEKLGILPKGTLDEIKKMDPIKPWLIDVGKLDAKFNEFRKRVKNTFEWGDKVANNFFKGFNGNPNDPNKGFHMKLNVGFESFQGTFERLQKAFAAPFGADIPQAQLGQLQQIREGIQKMAGNGVNVKNLAPAVQ